MATGTPGIAKQEQRTALYRFYDSHEKLLYVGITNDPWRRWRQHVHEQPWYPQVKHQAVTWCDTEEEARRAEAKAIRREAPEFNKAGALRPPRRRFSIHPSRWVTIAGVFAVIVWCLPDFMVPFPHLRVLVFCELAAVVLAPLTGLIALILVGAPWIIRFGAWLERNSVWREVAR